MIAHFLIHSQWELSYFINAFQRVSFRRTVPLPQDAQPLDTVHSDLRPPRCPVRRIASPSTKYDAPSSSPLLRLARTQDKMPPFRVRTEQGTIRIKEVKLSKKGDTPTPNGPCADTRRNPTFPVSYWGGGGGIKSAKEAPNARLCALIRPLRRDIVTIDSMQLHLPSLSVGIVSHSPPDAQYPIDRPPIIFFTAAALRRRREYKYSRF